MTLLHGCQGIMSRLARTNTDATLRFSCACRYLLKGEVDPSDENAMTVSCSLHDSPYGCPQQVALLHMKHSLVHACFGTIVVVFAAR